MRERREGFDKKDKIYHPSYKKILDHYNLVAGKVSAQGEEFFLELYEIID
jgi:hypothetical protein